MPHHFGSVAHLARRHQVGRVSVVTPPATTIFTTAVVKTHLRVETSDDDTLIDVMTLAAINEIDAPRGWLGRSLLSQTLLLTLDALPPFVIELPRPPITAVNSVKYRDEADAFITIPATDFFTDLTAEPGLLWADDNGWPVGIKGGPDTFRVEYVAGYANSAAIPDVIRQWLLMRISDMYRDRETTTLNQTPSRLSHADRMLDNIRIW